MKLLVSACLLGAHCRYNGGGALFPQVEQLQKEHTLIPLCPEQLGGLCTPREPAERLGERVVTRNGDDCTAQFLRGAQETLSLCRVLGCRAAVLKSRSPSCGYGVIYDGTFTGTPAPGNGVTAQLLAQNGIPVFSEENLAGLRACLQIL